MSERKPISKTLRFEVFKRDSFTCQYCGAKSPDVVLEVDHISPVAGGGTNDILNLVTACKDCNSGKRDRKLTENQALDKQRAQLEELNERREQLEMMIQWRDELNGMDDRCVETINDRLAERTGWQMSDSGQQEMRRWLRRYGLHDVQEALEAAFDQYFDARDDKTKNETWNKAFHYIPRIINARKRDADKPYMKELYYIRGICRNRFAYCNQPVLLKLLERCYLAGADIGRLQDEARACRNWTQYTRVLNDYLEEFEEP